jgi:hypothetical protein
MSLTPTQRTQRWRNRKRQAEVAAGLRPARKPKPKSTAQRSQTYRNRRRAKDKAAKFAPYREARAKRYANAAERGNFTLRAGRFQDKLEDLVGDTSTALILTDWPYEKGADPVKVALADFAQRKLAPGGSLIVYTGHHSIPRDHDILRAAGLTWHHPLVLLHGAAMIGQSEGQLGGLRWIREVRAAIFAQRSTILISLFAAGVLAFPPVTREMYRILADDAYHLTPQIGFAFLTLLLASATIWYVGRDLAWQLQSDALGARGPRGFHFPKKS